MGLFRNAPPILSAAKGHSETSECDLDQERDQEKPDVPASANLRAKWRAVEPVASQQ